MNIQQLTYMSVAVVSVVIVSWIHFFALCDQ